jgi:hypothetical protein
MTSSDLLVLHTLRCVGFVGLAHAAEAAGLCESDVESELIDLAVVGLVTRVAGEFGGWGLTEVGRVVDGERIADELVAIGARPVVMEAYEEFVVLNPELLDLCAAWQIRPVEGGANDHTDAAYDTRVLDLLTGFHQRAETACAQLFATMPRFARYQVRLTHALTQAKAGSRVHVTDSTQSYHTIWFQLHEDLLTTLGIPREH